MVISREVAVSRGLNTARGILISFMISLVLWATLLVGVAHATPTYGKYQTSDHGWIVWGKNDQSSDIRATCHWTASGTRWVWRVLIPAGRIRWTPSDAGNWGDRKPRNLTCSYRTITLDF